MMKSQNVLKWNKRCDRNRWPDLMRRRLVCVCNEMCLMNGMNTELTQFFLFFFFGDACNSVAQCLDDSGMQSRKINEYWVWLNLLALIRKATRIIQIFIKMIAFISALNVSPNLIYIYRAICFNEYASLLAIVQCVKQKQQQQKSCEELERKKGTHWTWIDRWTCWFIRYL